MALVPIAKDTYIDTDDLEQAEYHYYRRAQKLGRHDVASMILRGRLLADEIESNDKYSWLAD